MMLLHIIKRRRIGSNTDHRAVLLYLQYAAYSARVSDHHKARASTKFFSSLNNPTQNNRGRWHQMSEYSTTPQLFVKNGQGESRSDEDTKVYRLEIQLMKLLDAFCISCLLSTKTN
jgi:hypothetical protein